MVLFFIWAIKHLIIQFFSLFKLEMKIIIFQWFWRILHVIKHFIAQKNHFWEKENQKKNQIWAKQNHKKITFDIRIWICFAYGRWKKSQKNHFWEKKNQKKNQIWAKQNHKKITFDIRIWEQKNQKTIDIKTEDIAQYLSPTIENSKYSSIDD